ncbi:ADP-ribosylation factor GTPase-activating protein AGD12,Probable ADP-ribosylation factor GTPase-activating protein AGD13 [Mytilus edulis]|uniref:ADP-ribosylation factor GTPase-activating protein AGD12,Probable ADP-ribosylation factor GTPase-activating protein AGD13 n=1 Tax=Mytilus edulis TaxID=6550 RepID=A0A8S3SJ39_MYTED|nr:ADP-ribosylation factor GTPase-activating protein AGD12,Probable ADP-ribosylation factor GTPase-activating protein AGD13 [Mytilus edulis]
MADRNRATLLELLNKPGNNVCADCKSPDPEWVSVNLGAFLCPECAGCHRNLGTHISRVRSIKLDNWEDDQVQAVAELGNEVVNQKYEQFLPAYYKRPTKDDPELLRSEFVKAKYSRQEFIYPDRQTAYCSGIKEGYLYKQKDTAPKSEIDLDSVNVVFAKDKIGVNPNGLQITYFVNGQSRSLFVYADDPKEIVDWYYAIRAAKFEWRRIAHPQQDEIELAEGLTTDFTLEGWLQKMGPKKKDGFKKRWFTLDNRKLMYSEDPLSPFPKGEVYIGHVDGGYGVTMGAKDVRSSMVYVFTLNTPDRDFILSADTREDMDQWINAFKEIQTTEPTSQDLRLLRMLNNNS